VSATFRPMRVADEQHVDTAMASPGKLCGQVVTLSYGTRDAFVRGLDSVITRPTLTLQQEFGRELAWVDWKGARFSLRAEWDYVCGPAKRRKGCTAGERDANNHGLRPADFSRRANAFIAERRKQGLGVLLAEADAYLTLDEVLAVRLYSGPAYQPINDFLRQISRLTGAFRQRTSEHAGLTFAATVGHLCAAIRKLAAVATADEATAKLYRGVRGELPRSFWLPDDAGLVCAVDPCFMSTSRQRMTPIGYMEAGTPNVLWELLPQLESDSGYHCGASIEMLSQFAEEQEVLFPPNTLLKLVRQTAASTDSMAPSTSSLHVKSDVKLAANGSAQDANTDDAQLPERPESLKQRLSRWSIGFDENVDVVNDDGKEYVSILVTPTFL
jgi:hypothetical protein